MTLDPAVTFDTEYPLVGMVHLPALPGSPGYEDHDLDREGIRDRAVGEAEALAAGGMDAVLVENFGDAPFYPDDTPKHVVSDVTAVAGAVTDAVDVPVGVNVLRNDAGAALSVAAAVGAAFVRVNVHVGAAVTDQGVIEGRAHHTLRLRDRIDADVAVLADAGVKHAAPLADRGLATEIGETVERGRADGVVVSGPVTGEATPLERIRSARDAVDGLPSPPPLFVGSGVTPETVGEVLSVADGAIVGTALKEGGETTAPVDRDRVERLVAAADEVR